jgi:hypothetical protein
MKTRFFFNNKLLLSAIVLISVTLVQCKKDGTNASALDRSVASASIDSTLFSPFYDSTKVPYADVTPDANDYIVREGVLSVVKSNCATSNCHGGAVNPTLTTYAAVKSLVTAGTPENSKLWELLTTNDLNKAMPPVNLTKEVTATEKNIVYNWIKNGAKEYPALEDFRPAAIRSITGGCTSGNCHNEATAVGYWARSNYITYTSADTATLKLTNFTTGAVSYYPQMINTTIKNTVWNAYKDSARKFYADTLANASFRVWKVFGSRGPLNTYDDIMLDINYPKSVRSSSNAYSVNGVKVNCKGDYLNATSSLLSRVDSTILLANPRTGVFATTNQADMTWSDGGFATSDIAIIKAWYFSDTNVPDVWKFGINNAGIFKFRKSGNIITKK